jgi:hypothetical protein
LYLTGSGGGHIQSLILAGVFLITGFQTFLVAFLADVVAANRKLLEEIRYTQRTALQTDHEKQSRRVGRAEG